MGETNKGTQEKDSHAWRKKPRKWAPRTRRGCKTCKIRHIKCDLTQPFCMKCRSTGRTCDGYSETPPTFQAEVVSSQQHNEKYNNAGTYHGYDPHTISNRNQAVQWRAQHYNPLVRKSPRPFMVLPATGSIQSQAMTFFEYTCIKHLNKYHPCDTWRKTLMYFSQTVPSVRHAATALALIHRTYLDHDLGDEAYRPPLYKLRPLDKTPLFHYNRAIQLLLTERSTERTETTAITLLVCYLFYCFDNLAGDYVQAMTHLRGGVELSRNIDNPVAQSRKPGSVQTSELQSLISNVTGQIRRLDMQAVVFLVHWTPIDIEDTPGSPLPPLEDGFQSIQQAIMQLHVAVAQAMKRYHIEQQEMPSMNTLPPASVILERLERWSDLFENLLQRNSSYYTNLGNCAIISLLRLQKIISCILLGCCGRGKDMEYDKFLPQFKECLPLAEIVASAHDQYSGSLKLTFTPEVGILPVLYAIGSKCRDPAVRREVLRILQRRPIREAIWDSVATATVVERIIEIEEGGPQRIGRIQRMEEIAECNRVATLSWAQVLNGDSEPKVDIKYTFSSREGTYTESLDMR